MRMADARQRSLRLILQLNAILALLSMSKASPGIPSAVGHASRLATIELHVPQHGQSEQ